MILICFTEVLVPLLSLAVKDYDITMHMLHTTTAWCLGRSV